MTMKSLVKRWNLRAVTRQATMETIWMTFSRRSEDAVSVVEIATL